MKRTGDLKLMQELNRYLILDAIRKNGPISRAKVAQDLGISPTTVTAAVSDFIAEGLVEEAGPGESTLNGGRKPVLIQFCPDNQFLVCVSVTNSAIVLSEVNLNAVVKRKRVTPLVNGLGPAVMDRLIESIADFLGTFPSLSNCLGLSVVSPGIVDRERGVLLYNAKFHLTNVSVTDILEQRFGLKVWLENDANALVMAEKEMGDFDPGDNLVFVTIGDGIGTGIIVNGSVYRGAKGGAGEVGHISINKNGIRCECGNTGCLENYVGWPSVYSKICSSIVRRIPSVIADLCGGDLNQITPAIYHQALDMHDSLALEIADEAAQYLAQGLVTLTNILNPSAIVLGGELFQGNQRFLSIVQRYVAETALHGINDELVIRFTSLGEDDKLIGAATVALNQVFHFSI